ncbi:MAG: hypothetical protein ABI177_04800 [Edaphobacter sp.]
MTLDAVVDVLEKTIRALALLDHDDLQIQQERIGALAQSSLIADEAGMNLVLTKKLVLERLLDESASNLNLRNRLLERNMRNQWEH